MKLPAFTVDLLEFGVSLLEVLGQVVHVVGLDQLKSAVRVHQQRCGRLRDGGGRQWLSFGPTF